MRVTFIGHRDAPDNIYPLVKATVINLIENHNANTFYIGTHGNFDKIAHSVMKEVSANYNGLTIYTVLAYMPQKTKQSLLSVFETILPEDVATSIPKFAISKRNIWMINNSDTVIAYVKRGYGGAVKARNLAIAKNKNVITL